MTTELIGILPSLYDNGLLSPIECRKIVWKNLVTDRQSALYEVLFWKSDQDFLTILATVEDSVPPLLNFKILRIVFGFLSGSDVKTCRLVCQTWNIAAKKKLFDRRIKVKELFQRRKFDSDGSKFMGKVKRVFSMGSADIPYCFDNQVIQICQFLRSSVRQNLISKIEYWKITDNMNRDEIQASILKLLLSTHGKKLLNKFMKWRNAMLNLVDDSVGEYLNAEDGNRNATVVKVLENDAILNHLFRFFTLKDIQTYRTVCQQWNYKAELFYRKRGKIKFSQLFRPDHFMNAYSNLPDNDVPFTAFKISGQIRWHLWCKAHAQFEQHENYFHVSVLLDFFSKWGENVKHLHLCNVFVKDKWEFPVKCHDMSIFLTHLPNLSQLKVQCTNQGDRITVRLDALHSIKDISLQCCDISIQKVTRRIVPWKIQLSDVNFNSCGRINEEVCVNDFIDFSQAREIRIVGEDCSWSRRPVFDWTRENISAAKISLHSIQILNWAKSKAKVDYLQLIHCPLTEKTQMQIRCLDFQQFGDCAFDLSALPATLEKLKIYLFNHENIQMRRPIDLPNLKGLSVQYNLLSDPNAKFLLYFEYCTNLVDLELLFRRDWTLDLAWLPNSVKRMKLHGNVDVDLVDSELRGQIDLDLLFVCGGTAFCTKVTQHIRPEVLTVSFKEKIEQHRWKSETMDQFIPFLLDNDQFEQLIFQTGVDEWDDTSTEFENRLVSHFVDRQSDIYEFRNQRGKAITWREFESFDVVIS